MIQRLTFPNPIGQETGSPSSSTTVVRAPLEPAEPSAVGAPAGEVLKLGDPDQTKVTAHDQEPTGLVIPLGSDESEAPA
jgi:hypothetical protein